MSILRFETPLNWPEGLPPTPRNQQRVDHGFPSPLPLEESIMFLDQELQEAGVASAILFLDIEQPMVERLRKKTGSHAGACLRCKFHGKGYVLGCDRWTAVEHNVYALHLAFRHWRNIERWGVGALSVLMHGFEAELLPDAATGEHYPLTPWMRALGLGPTATLEDAVALYHRRAKLTAHDKEGLSRLNILMDEARAYFGARS